MKKTLTVACAFLLMAACAQAGNALNLNSDWRFSWTKAPLPLSNCVKSMEASGVAVFATEYDDGAWEQVSIPHPVNAHDTFDEHSVDPGEASFRRDMMFYRKRFALPGGTGNGERGTETGEWGTGKAFLTFEMVRQTVYVWVNGKFAGYYEAGVAPCAFDVTELLKDGENVVCVATDNTAMRGSKYFNKETIPGHEPGDGSGQCWQWNTTDFNEVQGGLVGSVSLVVKPTKTYLTLPYYNNLKTVGTYVTAKDFDFAKGTATICVKAEVRNESGKAAKAKLKVEVRDIRRPTSDIRLSVVECRMSQIPLAADAGKVYLSSLEADVYEPSPAPTRVNTPEVAYIEATGKAEGLVFWSPDTPHLYDVVVTLLDENGAVLDSETIRTGFREVKYDAAKGGLLVNGKNTWLTGYAQRSTDEWAAIGIPPQWMQDFDAELIRKSNANFVRWMHVAPKPAPMRAFDKYGIVNAVPAGDKEGDASGRTWAQRVEAMRDVIIYFRNSPSVFFWEAGNNQITPAHMKEMVELKKLLDPDGGRFMGCRTLQTKEQVAEAEYVGTMLHRHEMPAFDSMHALGKFIPIMETEYARQESPRRSWDDFTPPDYDYRGKFLNGGKKETGFDVYDQTQEDFALSIAKEYAAFYGSRSFGKGAKTYAACAALCWTDSNQHGRNSFSENCRSSGRVDAVRIPKMNFDVFRAMQSQDPAVTLVGHWSYPKFSADTYWYPVKKFNGKFMEETGEKAQRDPLKKTVYAIGSAHCASVELVVNGKSKGVSSSPKDVFVYEFPNVDVTESGMAEVIARDSDGKEIARHRVSTFEGRGKIAAETTTGPKGWLADGSDLAMVDFRLVDAKGTVHPFASGKISFELSFEPTESPFPISRSSAVASAQADSPFPTFMGGWNSGTFGETSPVGKDFVNLECGIARVFVKAGRTAGKATLKWRYDGERNRPLRGFATHGEANTPSEASAEGTGNGEWGTVEILLKPVVEKGGILAEGPQELEPNRLSFGRKTDTPFVQDLTGVASAAVNYTVFVNGVEVKFAKGLGSPVKPDDNTGVCCAFAPVLAALKAAGAELEYIEEPKRIPANKKWLRKLSPTPFVPMVTVKAGGREIDACAGFTELFLDNGKDKNLTNCEIYSVGKKNAAIVCGELAALVGYIPGVSIKTDTKTKRLNLEVAR